MKHKITFLLRATFLNFIYISIILFFFLLQTIGSASTVLARTYLIGAYLSSSFIFSLLPFFLTLLLSFFLSKRSIKVVFFIISLLIIAFLFIDFGIFRIYGFHFNGMVVAMITTPGFFDSVSLGTSTYVTFVFVLLIFFIIELFIIKKSESITISSKKIGIFFLILFFVTVSEKLIYAISDLYNRSDITKFSRTYPLYQPLTVKSFAEKVFHFKVNREVELKMKNSTLKYPQTEIIIPATNSLELPNILVIIIDSYRFDMLNSTNSPNIYDFSKRSLVFNKHYSGGNCTRFGIFSFFYGLYGYWWHDFLANRQSPVLIKTLKRMGYKFKILSATSLTFPEFRKTAFLDIPEAIEDDFGKKYNRVQREVALVNRFKEFRNSLDNTSPYFSFVFFDAPHARAFPEKYNKFKTTGEETNYLTIGKENVKEVKNAYMNAVYYDDALVKELLDFLEDKGDLENTIIVITGDHGEEFYENGHFGHNNSFSEYQVRVPFIFYLPDKKPRMINYTTSHYDFVPTLFDLLGVKADKKTYTFGENMLKEIDRKYILSCNWNWCSVIDQEGYRLVFSYKTHNSFDISLYDKEYNLVKDKELYDKKKRYIFELVEEFNKFY